MISNSVCLNGRSSGLHLRTGCTNLLCFATLPDDQGHLACWSLSANSFYALVLRNFQTCSGHAYGQRIVTDLCVLSNSDLLRMSQNIWRHFSIFNLNHLDLSTHSIIEQYHLHCTGICPCWSNRWGAYLCQSCLSVFCLSSDQISSCETGLEHQDCCVKP